jgi:aminodeoxyfutalosine synthase
MMGTFAAIADKVRSRERLNLEDGIFLFEKADLLELGALADEANRSKNDRNVYYNVNRHINPTNVCVKNCKFCAFSRKPGDEGAYEYSIDDILQKAGEVIAQGATEVHMVGGLHPRWRFDYYLEILSSIKAKFPQLHIKAFTAVEIDWLAAKARLSIRDTLLKLKEAGLGSMPGGGAEIFHPEIRTQICDTKTTAEEWIDIHRTAHSLGLRSNCTMLYGHIEKPMHRVDHMMRLRALQDETKGFNVFIPLAFQPQDNYMGITRYTPGADDLRTIAVARLMLDNFQHIKAYWIMLGQDIAQIALNFGANDLDGTVTEEKISRMAGGQAGMAMTKQFIQTMIRKADRIPVERDTLYHAVSRPATDKTKDEQKAEARRQAKMLLYKAEQGDQLSEGEYQTLAESAELIDLAHAAKRREHHHVDESSDVTLDLAADTTHDSVANLGALLARVDAENITRLKGLKQLWKLAHLDAQPLSDLLHALRSKGVNWIESSPSETEEDLTNTELMELHKLCHQAGLRTGAKIEINAAVHGRESVFWQRFVSKALLLRQLANETEGLRQISIDVAHESMVTPYEFLRAVSLLSMMFVRETNVDLVAPFHKIPTIKARLPNYLDPLVDPGFKVAPIAVAFGADHFGNDLSMMERVALDREVAQFR